MDTYKVMFIPASETDMANNDPNYSPHESCAGLIQALNDSHAEKIVKKGIQDGKYPKTSVPVFCD